MNMNKQVKATFQVRGLQDQMDSLMGYSEEGQRGISIFGALSKSLHGTSKMRIGMARKVGYSLSDALGLPNNVDPAPSIIQLAQQTSLLPLILERCTSQFSINIVILELTSSGYLSPMFQKVDSAYFSTIYLFRVGLSKYREVKLQGFHRQQPSCKGKLLLDLGDSSPKQKESLNIPNKEVASDRISKKLLNSPLPSVQCSGDLVDLDSWCEERLESFLTPSSLATMGINLPPGRLYLERQILSQNKNPIIGKEKKEKEVFELSNGHQNGLIKFFNLNKKYGFIIPSDGSSDIFFHLDDLSPRSQNTSLTQGTPVSYKRLVYTGNDRINRKAVCVDLRRVGQDV